MAQPGRLRRPLRGGWKTLKPNSQEKSVQVGLTQANRPPRNPVRFRTIFQATKLALPRWFLAMHLLTRTKNGTSALELKRDLGVCCKTALLLKHKIMEVMRLREDSRQLSGRIEKLSPT